MRCFLFAESVRFSLVPVIYVTALGTALTSCGSASFTGGGGGNQTTRVENLQPGPVDPAPNTPAPRATINNPSASQNPSNTTADTIQTINGIINTIRNNIDVSTNDREIVFGGDKVFHIGDGRFPASSCQSQLRAYDLSGTKYSFEFEVLEDNTLVEMDVLTVCGVDYGDSNYIRLLKNGSENVEQELLRVGARRADLDSMTLQKGRYMIQVESGRNTTAGVEGGDNDDFIVGKVRIRASKNISPGSVRIE